MFCGESSKDCKDYKKCKNLQKLFSNVIFYQTYEYYNCQIQKLSSL